MSFVPPFNSLVQWTQATFSFFSIPYCKVWKSAKHQCLVLWSLQSTMICTQRDTTFYHIFFSLQSGAMCVCQLGLALQHKMGCEIVLCKLWSYPLPLQLASYFPIVTKTCIVISMKNMYWIPFKTHHHDHHSHLQSNKSLLFTSKRGLERTQNQTTPSSSDP